MCVCVLGDGLPLFISDLGYATQVIQHVKAMGGLYPVCVRLSRVSSFFCVCPCVFQFVFFCPSLRIYFLRMIFAHLFTIKRSDQQRTVERW